MNLLDRTVRFCRPPTMMAASPTQVAVLPAPGLGLPAGGAQHPLTERDDLSGLLCDRDELGHEIPNKTRGRGVRVHTAFGKLESKPLALIPQVR